MVGELKLPRLRRRRPVPSGLEAMLERVAGAWVRHRAGGVDLAGEAEAIGRRLQAFGGQRDEHVNEALRVGRERWVNRRGRSAALRTDVLAVIGAVAERELGLVPHREQMMGVLGLERGWLLEMATGEGKTLTLAMAAVLTAWRRQSCHILTANDYLAGRDARRLRRFYERCGVTVAAVVGEDSPTTRRTRYRADVVYTTSRELVGDFLRDRLRLGRRVTPEVWRPWIRRQGGKPPPVVLPRLHTVLVDEADQVLVDEAVTPLIISAKRENDTLADLCREALAEARELTEHEDYTVDVAMREAKVDRRVTVDRAGAGRHALLRVPRWREEWLSKALVALHAHVAGKHYVVKENRIALIDESTGRLMADRSLGEGMHALLEAKEGVPVSAPTETMASLSFQRFFRQVPRLAGVTGTAADAAAEFWRLYRLPVVVLPTHRPVQRRMESVIGFRNDTEKWDYVVDFVQRCRQQGPAILVGTRTVAASEALADRLRQAAIPFTLLNAVRNADEAQIVAAAGRSGQVTIATNMAGRGTDIVPSDEVLKAGGLRVIATERHSSRRVDRQLYGRCARQGQPGVVQPLASWSDELVRHYLPAFWRRWAERYGGTGWVLQVSLGIAQWRAGRRDVQRRFSVLKHDQWLDENLSLGSGGPSPRISADRGASRRATSRPALSN